MTRKRESARSSGALISRTSINSRRIQSARVGMPEQSALNNLLRLQARRAPVTRASALVKHITAPGEVCRAFYQRAQ